MIEGPLRASTTNRGGAVLAVAFALFATACSSEQTKRGSGRPHDAGPDADANTGFDAPFDTGTEPNLNACRVRLEDPLNPCEPTVAEHLVRWQGNDFGIDGSCAGAYTRFQLYETERTWNCVYDRGGMLIAWERVEPGLEVCDGRAGAAFGNAYSRYQLISCLTVEDAGWTWIDSFDPGPTTISITLATETSTSLPTLSVGLAFRLGGTEIMGSELAMRYWYTSDASGSPEQSAECWGTDGLSCESAVLTIVPVSPSRSLADTYAEVKLSGYEGVVNTGSEFNYTFRITKADGSLYDQSNDYSFEGGATGMPTARVTAYAAGVLIYGTEP